MSYYQPYSKGSRLSVSSVVLLVIFVAAAFAMVAIVFWEPGFGGSSTVAPVQDAASQAKSAAGQAAQAAAPVQDAAAQPVINGP